MQRGHGLSFVAVLYALGAAVTLALTVIFLAGVDTVLFPDAMLPMQLYEQASVWLAWGAFPMGIVSVWLYRKYHISQSRKRWRNTVLIFIPMAVCAGFLIYWIAVWLWLGLLGFAMIGDYRIK